MTDVTDQPARPPYGDAATKGDVNMDRQARIDAMLDKQEITECIMRFSRGIDRHDVEVARSAFHEDARDDHGVYIGSGYGVIDWANEATDEQLRGSQHYVMNILIDLDGDEAHAETYAMLIGQEKGTFGHIFGGGRYLDRFERRDGRWGIVDRVLVIEWGTTTSSLQISSSARRRTGLTRPISGHCESAARRGRAITASCDGASRVAVPEPTADQGRASWNIDCRCPPVPESGSNEPVGAVVRARVACRGPRREFVPPVLHGNPHIMTTISRDDLATLREIESRVLWLATAMVHHANVRPAETPSVKVGGHQASSASMVTLMTALWFRHLRAGDRVSVKPHASPVLHAINHLLGFLDADHLPRLRSLGGLQSYPSRTKDPDPVDYSTGSVGIGATAPIWGAIADRYLCQRTPQFVPGRQFSLLGDAELDEGAVWEAIVDPQIASLGEVVWIVDVNRQSLDRVVPALAVPRFEAMFGAAGWQVITLKYGQDLEQFFAEDGGEHLRRRIDTMSNAEYQRLLRCPASEVKERLAGGDGDVATAIASVDGVRLHRLIRNLGGHDFRSLDGALSSIDDERPTVVFAYTVKGYRLSIEGHPQNHSALLSKDELAKLADDLGVDPAQPWVAFSDDSAAGRICAAAAKELQRDALPPGPALEVPRDFGRTPPTGLGTTQAALGRTLVELTRSAPDVAARIVTASPDVSSSTNLGGWVNKVGVWSPVERRDWFADDAETILHWREQPQGQHIELGIAETNLVGLIGELGATWRQRGERLFPIGVLYDPFVGRALEPWSFSMYAGGQSILVGTPSGITLAPEGGAHQSVITPSIGIEQPGCVAYEPAFAVDVEWILLDGMERLGRPDGSSTYLRLSTKPVDQRLAGVPTDPAARERRRRLSVAGGFVLRRAAGAPAATVVAMGAMVPDALDAANRLAGMDIDTDVVCITSADLLFRASQARHGRDGSPSWILDELLPADRAAPMVAVLDGHPHTLSFLATVNEVPHRALGITGFGESGTITELYRKHEIDTDSVVRAVLELVRT